MRGKRFSQAQRRWILAFSIASFLGMSRPAWAELTVESLTGTAISGVGPYIQDVSDAIAKFQNRDYAGAFANLEGAKKSTPRLAPPEVMMAQLYFDANLPLGGIVMLERAIRSVPQDPEAYIMLAERAVNERRITEADFLFQKAIKLVELFTENPKRKQNLQLRAYTGGALVDEGRNDWNEARAKLEALIKLDSKSAAAHERLGRVLFGTGDQKAAYAEFQLAAEADKQMLPAELAMATLFTDKANAEKWLEYAIKKGGEDLRTQCGAANYLLKTNQLEEAQKHADVALKLDPDGLDTNLVAGIIARMFGDYKKAETHLSKAHLLAPSNALIINNLALVLVELGDRESQQRALQYAELNARQNPNASEPLSTLGWVNYRLNRRAEAVRAFSAAFNTGDAVANITLTSETGYFMAYLAKDKGSISEAVKLLTDALNTDLPFAYRKKAEEMLTQLSKLDKSQKSKAAKSPAAGAPKNRTPKTDEPSSNAGAAK
jgi:tetratricopeptide (TPR) repeat protein